VNFPKNFTCCGLLISTLSGSCNFVTF